MDRLPADWLKGPSGCLRWQREKLHTHTHRCSPLLHHAHAVNAVNERNSIMFIHSKKKDRLNWKKLWHEIIFSCHRGRQTVRDMDGWRRSE